MITLAKFSVQTCRLVDGDPESDIAWYCMQHDLDKGIFSLQASLCCHKRSRYILNSRRTNSGPPFCFEKSDGKTSSFPYRICIVHRISWWRHGENTFRITDPLWGEPTVTGEFHCKEPVMWIFDDVYPEQAVKQTPSDQLIDTPWRSCNVTAIFKFDTATWRRWPCMHKQVHNDWCFR